MQIAASATDKNLFMPKSPIEKNRSRPPSLQR
jgi:hypothetical protein